MLVLVSPARNPESTSTQFSATVGGLYLLAGLVACRRRPDNAVGRIMQYVGIAWFAEDIQISTDPLPHTIGLLVRTVSSAVLVHLVLAFPTGTLRSRVDRCLVQAAYASVFVLVPLSTPFIGSITPNLLMITSVHWPVVAIAAAQGIVAAGIAVVLVIRWLAATRPARQVLAPVYSVALLGGAVSLLDALFTGHSHPLHLAFTRVGDLAVVLLPLAFLAGVWRIRRSRVTDLLVRLPGSSPARLRDLLADALADPSLRVAYIRAEDGAHLDRDGRPLSALPGHAVTTVSRDGREVAALLHDPALHSNPHVLAAVVSAAALELDNQRLTAELQARLLQVRASRARIVAAGDEQRRQVQRDLHDGAQQHLVACALTLRMARDELGDGEPGVMKLLERTAELLGTAQVELRELARGIHPVLLADAGLAAALRALAARVPVPVSVEADPLPALPIEIETTAYFVAAEAVTNALRHAHATELRIAVTLDSRLCLTVRDDGIGGAGFDGGTGLAGLRDRVAAVDGDLAVVSPAGHGTVVCAELPVAAR